MIECRSCSKDQDPDLFTNDMVRREAGKPQDRQNRQDITNVCYEFTEIAGGGGGGIRYQVPDFTLVGGSFFLPKTVSTWY